MATAATARQPEASTLAPGLRGPRTVPDIAVEERDGAYILLHPERASYLVTNEAGLRAYRLADGIRTAAEILEELSDELEIPVSELEIPIRSFCREVMRRGSPDTRHALDCASGHVRTCQLRPSEEAAQPQLYFEGYASHPTIRINTGFSGLVLPNSRNDPGLSWCPIGQVVTLKPNGDAYACALMMDEEDYFGNARHRGLRDLQESHGLKKAAEDVARRREFIPKCRACNWRNFRQGPCTGLTRIKTGGIWATDGFCDLRRAIYRMDTGESGRSPPNSTVARVRF